MSCLRLTVGETVFVTHVLRDCGSICNFMIISFRYFVIIPFAFVMVILIIILQ